MQNYKCNYVMVNFKPGEYMRMMLIQSVTQAARNDRIALHLHHCEYATYRHFSPSSMQDVCHMNLSLMALAPTSLL